MVTVDHTAFNYWLYSTMRLAVDEGIEVADFRTMNIAVTTRPLYYPDLDFIRASVVEDDFGTQFFQFHGRYVLLDELTDRINTFYTSGWYDLGQKDCVGWVIDMIGAGWHFRREILIENMLVGFIAGGGTWTRTGTLSEILNQFVTACELRPIPIMMDDLGSIESVDDLSVAIVGVDFEWDPEVDGIVSLSDDEFDGLGVDPVSVIDLTLDDD